MEENKTKKMLAAAYCRVSTKDEEQLKSFEHQNEYFNEMFEGSEEYELYKIYADKGKTGTKISRPGFNEMIKDAGIDKSRNDEKTGYYLITKKPKFEIILIKNTSRFARHDATGVLLQSLVNNGVMVKFIDTGWCTSDDKADIPLGLMSVLDKADSKDKSRKTSFGMWRGAKNKTILCNNKIYGYEYKPSPANKLVVIPEEAEIVKRMFEMYADEVGAHKIADILNRDGVRNRSGKPFAECTIRNMLANEKYCGIVARMKYNTGEIFKERKRTIRPIDEQIRFEAPDKLEGIVSEELFNKVQEIRKNRIQHMTQVGTHKGSSTYGYKIFCASCGKQYRATALIPYGDRKERYYKCVGKQDIDRNNRCTNPNVSETFLNSELSSEKYTEILAESYKNVQRFLVELKADFTRVAFNMSEEAELARLKAEQEEYEAQLTRANRAYALEGNEKIFDEIIMPISEKNRKVIAKINALTKDKEEKIYDLAEIDESIGELVGKLNEIYELEQILEVDENTVIDENGNVVGGTFVDWTDAFGAYNADYTMPPKKQFTQDEILSAIDRIYVSSSKNLTIKFKTVTEVEQLVEKYADIMTDKTLEKFEELKATGWNSLLQYNVW